MKCKISLLFFCLLEFSSCSEGPFQNLTRVDGDPVIVKPSVLSFAKEGSIYISWEEDEAAEEYILYRAQDAEIPVYQIFYQGQGTSATDSTVLDDTCYLYTLGKKRGAKLFGPSDPVLGVGSLVVCDNLEENNTRETAVFLEWDLNANIYYYLSYGGVTALDRDWYCVRVAPRRQANIVVTQALVGDGDSTDLIFAQEGYTPAVAINNTAIAIENTSYSEKIFYFLITPNPDRFIADPTQHGGAIVNYQVSLASITSL